jgi:alkanesulfonate monooxygenase SsuD/methylene tetrahydromethanopterin reductase-like flavin-dependent oxidoreductase (luciferase family)
VSVTLHWFLPTYGDSRHIVGGGHGTPAGAAHSDRDASIDYLASIVRAAETFGFTGALIPTGAWCEDAFITAALLARETTSLAFLVAFRPGLVSPTLSAQMAATFARHAPGRILLNVVVGGEAHEQRAFGDHLDKDARYRRADEFLAVVRRLWAGETVTHRDEETVRNAQAGLAGSQSEGQRRMLALHEANRANGSWTDARSLEITPNLWAGVGLVRGGAGTALVGSHPEVADRIAEYAAIGIDEFIFSGYPHLEELYWFGEGVVPILRRCGLFGASADLTAPASIPFVGAAR